MKQIGARQEAGRIGGIGACGRELCCASWISNFSSVTTNSARMQEISLNPQKLAGQCSKLKCCLAYEYDTYVDARKEFPRLREPLQALDGEYYLVKTDILAGTMSFSSSKDTMTNVVTLPVARVKEIIALNRAGKKVDQLSAEQPQREKFEEPTYRSEEDSITRFDNAKKRNRRKRKENGRNGENGGRGQHAERRTNGNGTAERRANGAGEEPRPAEEHAAAPQHGGAGKERNRNDRQRRRNSNGGAERQGQPERQEPREERTAQAEGRGEGDENAARRRNNRGRNRHNHPRHNGAAGNGEERREASRTEGNRQTTSEA